VPQRGAHHGGPRVAQVVVAQVERGEGLIALEKTRQHVGALDVEPVLAQPEVDQHLVLEQPVDQRAEPLGLDVGLVEVQELQLAARRGEGAAERREGGHRRRREVREP